MDYPLISVITPVYNSGKYLKRYIESLLMQTFSSFEVIFVDDGSTDDSASIIQSYRNDKFTYIKKENGGVSSARNLGLASARGRFVCFFDSDDTIDPRTLEIASSQACNADLLVFCYRDVLKDGSLVEHHQETVKTTGKEIIDNIFYYSSRFQIYSPCNKLYLLSLIKENNLSFECGLKIGEDYLFNLSAFKASKNQILFLDNVLYNYYQNDNSAINSFDPLMWQEQFRVVKETYNHKNCESRYEKEFIIKRIVFLFRYYKTKGTPNSETKRYMLNFYESLSTLNLRNGKKAPLHYAVPYFLLLKKRYHSLNNYVAIVNSLINIKRSFKKRK